MSAHYTQDRAWLTDEECASEKMQCCRRQGWQWGTAWGAVRNATNRIKNKIFCSQYFFHSGKSKRKKKTGWINTSHSSNLPISTMTRLLRKSSTEYKALILKWLGLKGKKWMMPRDWREKAWVIKVFQIYLNDSSYSFFSLSNRIRGIE